MNKPMATPNHLREQEQHDIECDKYHAEIDKRTTELLIDPVALIHDNVMDFEPWDNKYNFVEAFRTEDFTELGRQLYIRMMFLAGEQATEDVERG